MLEDILWVQSSNHSAGKFPYHTSSAESNHLPVYPVQTNLPEIGLELFLLFAMAPLSDGCPMSFGFT